MEPQEELTPQQCPHNCLQTQAARLLREASEEVETQTRQPEGMAGPGRDRIHQLWPQWGDRGWLRPNTGNGS